MLKHRWTDRICCVVLALTLLITVLYMGAAASGLLVKAERTGYETRLFDTSRVHSIDIVMDDWEGFLKTCANEEYAACTAVIDGEKYANIAIRAKGNTSLSSVAAYGNNRYSFKIEFDHYISGKSYYGLDKLCLNNIIQDNTYVKDYLAYTLMNKMGVASPLCSFAYITVNGHDWGLYLAVEAVEDAFLLRNYGGKGEMYKPDSMSFGGGRGNGRDFDMDAFREQFQNENASEGGEQPAQPSGNFSPFGQNNAFPGMPQQGAGKPENPSGGMPSAPQGFEKPEGSFEAPGKGGGFGGFGGFGMGNSDVQLQYIDDNPESYPNIFGNAKTSADEAAQARLIASLKALSQGDASVVDQDAVLRYMAVHNFLCNDDSYTGMMVHNYYLYESNGVMSMIPWDYNLSMGGMGMNSADATGTVNTPIDTLVSQGNVSSRPMAAWITSDNETLARYHAVYQEFIDKTVAEGWLTSELDAIFQLIAPYVEKDPTAFCSYEDFLKGYQTLKDFCALRLESIAGQLSGAIPSTSEGQRADSSALIDASALTINDMGSMNGMGGGAPGGMPDFDKDSLPGGMPSFDQMPNFNGTSAQNNSFSSTGVSDGLAPSTGAPSSQAPSTSAPDGQIPNIGAPNDQTSGTSIPDGQTSNTGAPNGQTPNFGPSSGGSSQGEQTFDFSSFGGAPAQNGQPFDFSSFGGAPAQNGQMPSVSLPDAPAQSPNPSGSAAAPNG